MVGTVLVISARRPGLTVHGADIAERASEVLAGESGCEILVGADYPGEHAVWVGASALAGGVAVPVVVGIGASSWARENPEAGAEPTA